MRDTVAKFLASAVVWATEARDPHADRLAMLASDLLAKIKATDDDGLLKAAREMGFEGPAGGSIPQNSIAADVLARAQTSIDSDSPDPQAVAAGLQACRRLIVADLGTMRPNLRRFYAYLQLGGADGAGMLAPEALRGDVGSLTPFDADIAAALDGTL